VDRNAWRKSHSHVTGTLLNSDFPFRFGRSIIRLSRVCTVPPPCLFACAVPPPCNERLPTAQRRPQARNTNTESLRPQCRGRGLKTRFKQDGILQIPKMKILHRTLFRSLIFPQVKTSLRSQVQASTKLRGARSSSISNNLCGKSLTTTKVIPISPTSGKIECRSSGVIWLNRVVDEEHRPSWEFRSPDSSSCLLLLTTTTL
jgi:hypothetical protein